MFYAYNRPTADFRSLHEAAIRMAGVLRNLPESQFTQIGLSRAWHTGKTRAATRRTAAAQPAINLNGNLLTGRCAHFAVRRQQFRPGAFSCCLVFHYRLAQSRV